MNRIVGIDLGTTNSLVAAVESGIPMVLADAEGQRLTPSVVYFPDGAGEPLVGRPATRMRILHPAQTVYSAKRFMGRRGFDLAPEDSRLAYPVKAARSEAVVFPLMDRECTPEEVAAEVLKKLRRDAQAALGGSVTRAVITVPAYFNNAQRAATKRAGEAAGLTVERIVNEPTAAALAYGLDRLQERSRIAVYDLGGGTFDLSILELNEGTFQVLATNGNTRLGGDDLDRRLVGFLAEKIVAQGGPDLGRAVGSVLGGAEQATAAEGVPEAAAGSPASVDLRMQAARLREAAEQAKVRLSLVEEVEVALPFLTPDFSFSCRLSRSELEQLARDLVLQTRAHCLRAMADAKLEPAQLDQVILVGGQTRMPLVRRLVAEWFQCANAAEFGAILPGVRTGPALNVSQNPDEAVALGAAIQAEILAGGFQNVLLLDVTPLSLGIETFGGLMNVIIPRNTTIPAKAGELFTTAVDGQRSVLIHVLQGERERARDNWSLGRFALESEPAAKGVPRVGVQFEIDADGLLHVLARDTRTGREKTIQMRSVVDVDDTEVQRMVEASIEHAAADIEARRWVEARLRASETAAATRKGLESAGAELPSEQVARIRAALEALEAHLEAEDPATKAGNVQALKLAASELDEATRPLADLLMDRAMLAMLEKRGLVT